MRNALVLGILFAAASVVAAQTSRPALSQLDAEMRALYAEVAAGTVRVRLPAPSVARLIGPEDHPLNKWREQLDARVLRNLEDIPPATQPLQPRTTAPGDAAGGGGGGLIQGAGDDAGNLVTITPGGPKAVTYIDDLDADRLIAVWPREYAAGRGDFVGIVLDDAGYVAIPAYVTREELGGRTLRVTAAHEQIDANFVGSDRQTNVTVLKLAKPVGKPMPLAADKPKLGALVLVLSPTRTGAKLALWSGGQDDNAVVVNAVDGTVAGFARPGQMLACGGMKSVIQQIIEHGRVKRAQLGVLIAQVPANDPIRQQVATLGARPALRVAKVMRDTAASAAGLRTGDLILSLAGEPVEDLPTFAAAISSHSGPTELKVIRDGQETTVKVDLQPQ